MSSRKEWSVAWDWCETSDGLVGEICLREYPRRTDPLKVRFLWSADSAPENIDGPVLSALRHSQQGSGMSNRIIRELLFVHGADIPFSNESSAAIAIALARESAEYLGAVLRC